MQGEIRRKSNRRRDIGRGARDHARRRRRRRKEGWGVHTRISKKRLGGE